MSGKNVNQRVKSRRAGAKSWEVGEPINGIGNYLYGRKNHLQSRVSLSNNSKQGLLNALKISTSNQLGGVGRFKSQFVTGSDSVNFNVIKKDIIEEVDDIVDDIVEEKITISTLLTPMIPIL